jgi:hypothetical protein
MKLTTVNAKKQGPEGETGEARSWASVVSTATAAPSTVICSWLEPASIFVLSVWAWSTVRVTLANRTSRKARFLDHQVVGSGHEFGEAVGPGRSGLGAAGDVGRGVGGGHRCVLHQGTG